MITMLLLMMLFYLILVINVLVLKNEKFLEILDYRELNLTEKKYKFYLSISVFLGYVFFFKLLRAFSNSKYIDINQVLMKVSYLQINYVFFFKKLRNFVIFWFKLSFLSLNYWCLARSDIYLYIYSHFSVLPQYIACLIFGKKKKGSFWVMFYSILKIFFLVVGEVLLLCFLIYDLFKNHHVLVMVSKFLPIYSIYKIFYWILLFFNFKTTADYEYNMSNSIYVKYLHEKKLEREYIASKQKMPLDTYKIISIYSLGDVPPETSVEGVKLLNNYLRNMF